MTTYCHKSKHNQTSLSGTWRVNVTVTSSEQDLPSAINSPSSSKSFLSRRRSESSWRRTRLTILKSKRGFRSWLAKSDLVCLSGLTTAPFLALFTAPPSPRATASRYCAHWRCFRSVVPTVPSVQSSSVRSRYYSVRPCRVQKKSRVKQPFNFHVDLPPCQHRPSP
jgi:hypothetical protein